MRFVFLLIVFVLCSSVSIAFESKGDFQSWHSSPNNWENSHSRWQNSPDNWRNSPNNWRNSPLRFNNKRILRDNIGNPRGYIVPKSNGGLNVYDLEGERQIYLPPRDY
jgi:hypothetical protein